MTNGNNDLDINIGFIIDDIKFQEVQRILDRVKDTIASFSAEDFQDVPSSSQVPINNAQQYNSVQSQIDQQKMSNIAQSSYIQQIANQRNEGIGGAKGEDETVALNRNIQAADAQIKYLEEIAENTKMFLSEIEKSGVTANRTVFGSNIENQERALNVNNQLLGSFTNIEIPLNDSQGGRVTTLITQGFQKFNESLSQLSDSLKEDFEGFVNTFDELEEGAGDLQESVGKFDESVGKFDSILGNFDEAIKKFNEIQLKPQPSVIKRPQTETEGELMSLKTDNALRTAKERLVNMRTKALDDLFEKFGGDSSALNAKNVIRGRFGGSFDTAKRRFLEEGKEEDEGFKFGVLDPESDLFQKHIPDLVKRIKEGKKRGQPNIKKLLNRVQADITNEAQFRGLTGDDLDKFMTQGRRNVTNALESGLFSDTLPAFQHVAKDIKNLELEKKIADKFQGATGMGAQEPPIEVKGAVKIEGLEALTTLPERLEQIIIKAIQDGFTKN